MKKFRDFVYGWLEHEESFISWMVILNVTALWVTYGFFLKNFQAFVREFMFLANGLTISFLVVSIVDLVLYVFLRKFRAIHKIAKSIFIIFSLITFCADVFTRYYFNIPLNRIMFEFITMTNARESREFLQTYLANLDFWIFAAVIIAAVVLLRVTWTKIFNRRPNLRFAVSVLCLVVGSVALGRQFYVYGKGLGVSHTLNSTGLFRLSSMAYFRLINIRNDEKEFLDVTKEAVLTKNESSIPYIVYILGESTTRNHLSLYGYKLVTNPLLSRRKDSRGGGGGKRF